MVIDIHNHIFIQEAFNSIENTYKDDIPVLKTDSDNKTYIKIGKDIRGPMAKAFFSVSDRLIEMKEEGVDKETLSVFPYTFFYDLDVEEALALSKCQNDAIYQITRDYPEHFLGLATVPLQDPQEAIEEMERAILKLKMVGVSIGSNVNGKNLDDLSLRPFFKRAQEPGAFIFVYYINVVGHERLQDYYMQVIGGNPSETSVTIASMIYGGVFAELPNLKVCFALGGGFLPYQIGRLEKGFLVRPETRKFIKNPPSSYLKNIYFDTVLYETDSIEFMVKRIGAKNILFGTDSPVDMHDHDGVSRIKKMRITLNEKKLILEDNASRLLGINYVK
ncbi:MAG: amidohydrolase family protein [Thermoplasmata archaeon]